MIAGNIACIDVIYLITNEICIIQWALNRGKTVEQYLKDMNAVLDRIRVNHPETSIFLLNLLQSKNNKSKKTDFTLDDFREALRALYKARQKAGDKKTYLIDSDTMTNTEEDLNDVVHLSYIGAEKLANSIAKKISETLR